MRERREENITYYRRDKRNENIKTREEEKTREKKKREEKRREEKRREEKRREERRETAEEHRDAR